MALVHSNILAVVCTIGHISLPSGILRSGRLRVKSMKPRPKFLIFSGILLKLLPIKGKKTYKYYISLRKFYSSIHIFCTADGSWNINTLESSEFIEQFIKSLSILEHRDNEMLSLLAMIWDSSRLHLLLHHTVQC